MNTKSKKSISKFGPRYEASQYVALPWDLLEDLDRMGLTRIESLLLIALISERRGEETMVYPSYVRLASRAGVSPKNVGRSLHELESRKLIAIIRKPHTVNHYDVAPALAVLAALPPLDTAQAPDAPLQRRTRKSQPTTALDVSNTRQGSLRR